MPELLQIGTRTNDQRLLDISGDEVFLTEQGEGPTMGEQAVFLRLQWCDLQCTFCDTARTWNKDAEGFGERTSWTVEETARRVAAESQGTCTRLVITGGEPLLDRHEPLLAELCAHPLLAGWQIEIETNGRHVPEHFREREHLQINCSPKLRNSGMAEKKRIVPHVLHTLAQEFNTYFKFVVASADDIDEIVQTYLPILDAAEMFPRGRIFVSPEGTDAETLDRVLSQIRQRVAALGFTLGDRRHIRLHGNTPRT